MKLATRTLESMNRRWVLALLLVTALPGSVFGQSAVIYDAWWTDRADADGDGCWEGTNEDYARLHCDPDLLDSGSLAVDVYMEARPCGSDEVVWWKGSLHHVISGNAWDDVYLDVPMGGGCRCFDYEIHLWNSWGELHLLDTYNWDDDSDLNDQREETLTVRTATIGDAWWTDRQDGDADGCWAGTRNLGSPTDNFMTLHWDADVVGGSGSLDVMSKLFRKPCGGNSWESWRQGYRTITGNSSVDAYEESLYPLPAPGCTCFDYKIEVTRAKESVPNYVRDPSNDGDLNDQYGESIEEDGVRATIYRVWWSNQQDEDRDGCVAGIGNNVAVLNWDPDVAGSSGQLSVFEVVSFKHCDSLAWSVLTMTAPHTITSNGADDTWSVLVPMGSGCACYDYRIDLYRNGQGYPDDTQDTFAHWEESLDEDAVLQTATIHDAWWTNQQDNDGDGCIAGDNNRVRLNWDPDVVGGNGSLSVFEYVDYKYCNAGDWTYATHTAPHTITGNSSADSQYVDIPRASGCTCFDYRISVYRSDQPVPDHTRDPSNDTDLNDHLEEWLDEDGSWATIFDAWWSDRRDDDGDGCWAGADNGIAQLHWDPNVIGAGSLTVFEKIYSADCGTGAWVLLATSSTHVITGQGSGDAQFMGIAASPGCDCRDYRIDIYREG